MKVRVTIEEHLSKTIEIDVPDELGLDADSEMEYAEDKVKEMYDNEEIILTADDHNGTCLWMTEHEDGTSTDWRDM